ncbi:MAG TPA: PorV/PorQ family protein [Candidatus Eisenbacteria bacterium]
MFGRKRGAMIAVASLLATGVFSLTASAAENESSDGAAFLRGGVGPRYLAMGKAGTAIANDVYAGYWNPAGLAYSCGWQVAGMYTGGLDFDRAHNFVGASYGKAGNWGIGFGWTNAGTGDIQGRTNGGAPTEIFDYGENALALSFAKAFDRFSIGGTGKYVVQDVGTSVGVTDDNATGFGLDIGAQFHAGQYLDLAVQAQDLWAEVGEDEGTNDVPTFLKFGGAIYPTDGLTISSDVDLLQDDDGAFFRIGGEYAFDMGEDFDGAVRLGLDAGRFAGGLGFGMDWVTFDYAYVVEPEDFQGSNHRLGLKLNFGCDEQPMMARSAGDRDHDGIPDDTDRCPDQPEDFDGFQDTDGCPDPDNDGDGVVDAQDQCPGQAEDFDGFEDTDGCPDLDNDKDGILDKDDKCPSAPETFNGYEDADGCPDDMPFCFPIAYINFKFNTAEMTHADYIPVLEEVARIMKENSEIRVEIQGHTDSIGSDEYNQSLSERRSQAVKDYLIAKGIGADRMTTRGFGESQPIDTNDTDLGRARNRRIEFKVIKQ